MRSLTNSDNIKIQAAAQRAQRQFSHSFSCYKGVFRKIKITNVTPGLVCKIPLLARALGLKAKRARDDRVSCIQPWPSYRFKAIL